MADRPVTQTRKDRDGDIIALCNPESDWLSRGSEAAISDIESRAHTYHVPWKSGRTEIHVVDGPNGKYLRTDRDNTPRNNLDDLPDC